jgi:hypothetical protein
VRRFINNCGFFLIAFVIFFNALRVLAPIDFSSCWSRHYKVFTGHSGRLGAVFLN